MLKIESKSPVDLSRKAKFITSIAIGDPKMNQYHSTDQELNGKLIAPAQGKETYNQAYGIFEGKSERLMSPNRLENKREHFLQQLGLFKNAALPHIS